MNLLEGSWGISFQVLLFLGHIWWGLLLCIDILQWSKSHAPGSGGTWLLTGVFGRRSHDVRGKNSPIGPLDNARKALLFSIGLKATCQSRYEHCTWPTRFLGTRRRPSETSDVRQTFSFWRGWLLLSRDCQKLVWSAGIRISCSPLGFFLTCLERLSDLCGNCDSVRLGKTRSVIMLMRRHASNTSCLLLQNSSANVAWRGLGRLRTATAFS